MAIEMCLVLGRYTVAVIAKRNDYVIAESTIDIDKDIFSKISMYSNAAISSKVENLIFESKRSHLEIILSSTPLASSHILTPFMNKDSLILYGV